MRRGLNAPCERSLRRESRYTTELTTHTRHAAASTGRDCLNCHMPHSTYALFKAIRTHQIASPQVRSSARHGVPNACNLCHLDRTLEWTQEQLGRWYGQKPVPLSAEQRGIAASLLWLLKGNAAQRVITAWHFGWDPARAASGTGWTAPFLAPLLADAYGPVRFVAARSLRSLPDFADLPYDFLGAPADWTNSVTAAGARWLGDPSTIHARPHLLLRPDGSVDAPEVSRLLREQDARSVSIMERGRGAFTTEAQRRREAGKTRSSKTRFAVLFPPALLYASAPAW